MDYYTSVAKRTRSQRDKYYKELYYELMRKKGKFPTSKKDELRKTNHSLGGTSPVNSVSSRTRSASRIRQPERNIDLGFDHDNQCEEMEVDGKRNKMEVPDAKIEHKSKPGPHKGDDVFDVDDDLCEEIEVEGRDGNGFDDQCKENEIKEVLDRDLKTEFEVKARTPKK
ncbi:hypothetical protein F0562_018577 [Nyssa sinensis]|uniref:Uncharacterized protein n=1 Tax=Nyssa sinensis TaxID=561372 RepID=A0A5J4ZDI0_9ASTE|nr:hypothetical protein F0562_018577 [Nyssa sinensis]